MSALREMQAQFAQFVYARQPTEQSAIVDGIAPSGVISPAGRMSIYRNNTLVGLSKALANAYPVIKQLVGDEFFDHLAQQFIFEYPSQNGDLAHYGEHFADFLQRCEACQSLVYLPDVARLEYAFNLAYAAPGQGPIDLALLAEVDPADYEQLHFSLHPSSTLLQSDYPIADIWSVNQADADPNATISLDQGGCQLLICRPEMAVKIMPVSLADFAFLEACRHNQSFGEACDRALQQQADYDVATALRTWVAGNVLSALTR